jgi:DNA-binding MarR family transcriptional regulator
MSSSRKEFSKTELKKREALMEEMQFLGQMSSTETALFHQKVAEKVGLGITDMKTISTLMQEGPMTAGQIAERLSLTTGAVTSVIDRLEKVGAVKRHSDPNDRRKVIVKVVLESLHKQGNLYDSIGETFSKLLQKYSTKELEFLVEYYKVSIELTKLEIAKLGSK